MGTLTIIGIVLGPIIILLGIEAVALYLATGKDEALWIVYNAPKAPVGELANLDTKVVEPVRSFRKLIDNIICGYPRQMTKDAYDEDDFYYYNGIAGDYKRIDEVILVSRLIAKETITRSNRDLVQLTDEEIFIGMLIGFEAAHYISGWADVSSELTGMRTSTRLVMQMCGLHENSGHLTSQITTLHNHIVQGQHRFHVSQAIGTQVAGFFETADEKYLDRLAECYEILLRNVHIPALNICRTD